MKILTIVGARPQFVKAAAVSRAIKKHPDIQEFIVHTGQHFDSKMSDVFFEEMDIPTPHRNLNINTLSHGAMTGRMLECLEEVMVEERPDAVLVYGDTNSTLAGGLAAVKLHIPLAHVEAGLRSHNRRMPEEINRLVTDQLSAILYCPTQTAVDNLHREGFENGPAQIVQCGDVMYDAALFYAQQSAERSTIKASLPFDQFVLCTIHRAENTDDPNRLGQIIDGLNQINDAIPVVCPLHPRTKKILDKEGINPSFHIIDPVGYFDMIELLKGCSLVITDSGGLQKEAYFFKKSCLTARDETEWVELVENGFNVLVGADSQKMTTAFQQLSSRQQDFSVELYGKGDAADKIVHSLIKTFQSVVAN